MRHWLCVLRRYRSRLVLVTLAAAAVLASAGDKPVFRRRQKAAFADERTVNFVRPGLAVRINSGGNERGWGD